MSFTSGLKLHFIFYQAVELILKFQITDKEIILITYLDMYLKHYS